MILLHIIIATLSVGLVSFLGAIFFGLKIDVRKFTFYLISLASGTMLGGALLHLVPESISLLDSKAYTAIGIGVFLFFILEKFLIWRHCHDHHHTDQYEGPVAAAMVLTGDAIHNVIDGIIIASAFMVDASVGLSVTLAIALHEIPQEIGDFGVLIHGGYSIKKALLFNALTALGAVGGGVITYFFLGGESAIRAYILPVAAGGFLYIALADLIPQLHKQTTPKQTFGQILLLSIGFGLMVLLD